MLYEAPNPTITAVAYDVKDAFGDPGRAQLLIDRVTTKGPGPEPTVAFFSEAYDVHSPGVIDDALDDFETRGYTVLATPQELVDVDRPDAHGILMVAKSEFVNHIQIIELSGRAALWAEMYDPATDQLYEVFGHHGNDKNEELREADIRALGSYFDLEDGEFKTPTMALTQGNTALRRGLLPNLLYAAGPVVRRLPASVPGAEGSSQGLMRHIRRFGSVSQRTSGMAAGGAYDLYEALGLTNADPTMEWTIKQRGVAAKHDHILVSPQFEVDKHTVHPYEQLAVSAMKSSIMTSHKKISAQMRLKPVVTVEVDYAEY